MEPTYSPCLKRFIEISSGLGEDDSLDAQREAYSLSSKILQLQMPEAVDFYDESIRTRDHDVPVRHYRLRDVTPDALIVYFHGGGWVKGDLNSHHEVVATLAEATGAEVLAVDYPLAPENRHPAQLLSGYEVLHRVATHRAEYGATGPIVVAGDSAGGQIAASLCMLARQEGGPTISGQVLVYPALDHRCDSDSVRRFSEGPLLLADSMKEYWKAVMPHFGDTAHFLSPLLEHDLSGLPTAIIQLAETDVLHDEAIAYGIRLKKDGVSVDVLEGAGMVHGFIRAIGLSEGARIEFDRLCGRVRAMISRISP
jgi:acetyl esterase